MKKEVSNFFVSVMIPTMGRVDPLKKCLISLEKQKYKNFEIVLIDGEKNSGVPGLLKEFSSKILFRYAVQKKKGIVEAIQDGFDLCKGEIFLRTDDDIIASPGWLSEIVNTFKKDVMIGGVTGPTSMPEDFHTNRDLTKFVDKIRNGKNFFWCMLRKFYFDYILERDPFAYGKICRSGALSLGAMYPVPSKFGKVFDVDYLESCNWAVKRDLIINLGKFDKGYGGVGENFENDTTCKIKKKGYKLIFNPKARISHHPSKAGVYSARGKTYSRLINFQRFYFRHIKIDSLDKFFRFLAYILFQNFYYFYKFFQSRQTSYLECIPASFIGFVNGTTGKYKDKYE